MNKLSADEAYALNLFNEKVQKVLNSKFIKESNEKKLGETLEWNLNDSTGNLDFSYSVLNHDEDWTQSVLMTIRMFKQDDDKLSIRNLSKFYESLDIDKEFKTTFTELRTYLNDYLDNESKTLLDDKPTRRILLDTILYGDIAHTSTKERQLLEKWKSDEVVWDLAYVEFERIIHEFINVLELIKNLNERVLTKYANM